MPRWQNLVIALASKACVRKDFSVQIRALALIFINSPSLLALMKIKILNNLFLVLIAIMVILFLAIILITVFEKGESKVGSLPDITGAMQSYDVYHQTQPQYAHVRTSEKYDDTYFEYLEHIQKRRDESFMR